MERTVSSKKSRVPDVPLIKKTLCHGDNWYRYCPIICNTEKAYSEGLVRLVQLSPDIPEGTETLFTPDSTMN
jgi:hypothetical protein